MARPGALLSLALYAHKIRQDLPHLKAVIQYLGTPPVEEGVYEVSDPLWGHWGCVCSGAHTLIH